jgi:IstB-like ATP binding protein
MAQAATDPVEQGAPAFEAAIPMPSQLRKAKLVEREAPSPITWSRLDLEIWGELGYLPFSVSGGALLFHLLSKPYERISVVITTLLDHVTPRHQILETGNDSFRFKASLAAASAAKKRRR